MLYTRAEGFKGGPKKSYMKSRKKTALCKNWLDARKDRDRKISAKALPNHLPDTHSSLLTAPPRAPKWWGCPRGRECDFAHGEDELRGKGLVAHKAKRKEEEEAKRQQRSSDIFWVLPLPRVGLSSLRNRFIVWMHTRAISHLSAATWKTQWPRG